MTNELIIVFEDQPSIQVEVIPDKFAFDLDYLVKVGKVKITNEDGTLILRVNGNTTNIDTDVIQIFDNYNSFPNQGKEKVLYIDLEEKSIYCWTNNVYQLMSELNSYADIYMRWGLAEIGQAYGGETLKENQYTQAIKKRKVHLYDDSGKHLYLDLVQWNETDKKYIFTCVVNERTSPYKLEAKRYDLMLWQNEKGKYCYEHHCFALN